MNVYFRYIYILYYYTNDIVKNLELLFKLPFDDNVADANDI